MWECRGDRMVPPVQLKPLPTQRGGCREASQNWKPGTARSNRRRLHRTYSRASGAQGAPKASSRLGHAASMADLNPSFTFDFGGGGEGDAQAPWEFGGAPLTCMSFHCASLHVLPPHGLLSAVKHEQPRMVYAADRQPHPARSPPPPPPAAAAAARHPRLPLDAGALAQAEKDVGASNATTIDYKIAQLLVRTKRPAAGKKAAPAKVRQRAYAAGPPPVLPSHGSSSPVCTRHAACLPGLPPTSRRQCVLPSSLPSGRPRAASGRRSRRRQRRRRLRQRQRQRGGCAAAWGGG